jgi:hypothetical protein
MKWTLETALEFIRNVEPVVRRDAYCCLGLLGGVLRKGESDKDLDIIIIPMNGKNPPDVVLARMIIAEKFGAEFTELNAAEYNKQEIIPLQFFGAKNSLGLRIDLVVQK